MAPVSIWQKTSIEKTHTQYWDVCWYVIQHCNKKSDFSACNFVTQSETKIKPDWHTHSEPSYKFQRLTKTIFHITFHTFPLKHHVNKRMFYFQWDYYNIYTRFRQERNKSGPYESLNCIKHEHLKPTERGWLARTIV